ncbi:MAG: PAS domain-containing sensor histidine kinase, partial [Acidobacteriota bacterium]
MDNSARQKRENKIPTSFENVSEAQQILTELGAVFFPEAATANQRSTTSDVDAETKYQTLIEQIPAVVFMAFLDKGLSEAYVSPHIETILGFTQKEWLEDPVRWYRQIHPDDRNRWNIEAADMLLTGQPLRSVYRVLARDNHTVWFQVEAKMVRTTDGRPWFIHGVAFDISELKKAEETLQKTLGELEIRVESRTAELADANRDLQMEIAERKAIERERTQLFLREQEARKEAEGANRAKDEFLATVSHELRTPLNVIRGWTHLLQSGQLDDAALARALEVVDQSAKAQSKLIEDLLDVSTMIAGKIRLDLRPIDLVPSIENAVSSLKLSAEAKGIKLVQLLDSHMGPVLGDSERLQQVILNLLSNAIKFTPSGGRVTISLERIDSSALVTVTDTGEGIKPEFVPHVFTRFRQQDSSFTRKYGGLG